MTFIRVNNVILDFDKVTYVYQTADDVNTVKVLFDNGEKMEFAGPEAAEIWRVFDPEPGWRDDDFPNLKK